MSDILPLFPLQLVAFPGEDLNLHVFEPRYRQMMQECEADNSLFGIPPYLGDKLMPYGTTLQLVEIEQTYDDGKMDVRTRGVGIFRIDEFYKKVPSKLYAGARVQQMPMASEGSILMAEKIIERIEALFELLNIDKNIPSPTDFSTFSVGHHVGFTAQQEYELLTIRSEKERQDYMLEHLDQFVPMVREMEKLRERVRMNGHFKNVIPPNF